MVNSSSPVPVFILMGTAGCGKTSVAEQIQELLHCEYIEGDALHPQANVDKMSKGEPLNDDDRWPWLRVIRDTLKEKAEALQSQDPSNTQRAVVLTCSSLRKVYRDIMREVPAEYASITFVYLKGSKELLQERIGGRQNHFMGAKMLESQLNTLEEPDETQEQVIVADIRKAPAPLAKWIVEEANRRNIVPFQV
ncbi:shikimate kinase [Zychaea mexicana]|uniref:shikimate kinase n=1 Tax=Zychaea mexicana TaxID=64656 RepID=UPI0022FEDCA4|nr:shikimate kinase [Zychaea mexicana]KAI9484586.1 shikimate kinase [Zychaea mexicana]